MHNHIQQRNFPDEYAGQTESSVRDENWYIMGGPNVRLNFDRFYWTLNTIVSFQQNRLNQRTYNDWLPRFYTTGGWSINEQNTLRFASFCYFLSTGASHKSPTLVLNNELDAIEGNPDLHTFNSYRVMLTYIYTPVKNLSLAATGIMDHYHNQTVYQWRMEEVAQRNVMVRSLINNGNYTEYSAGLSAVWRLFDNKLFIQGGPTYYMYRQTGMYHRSLDHIRLNAQAQLSLGPVQLSASYQKPYKQMNAYLQRRKPCYYSLEAGCAYRGFFFSLKAKNIFSSSYLASRTWVDGDNYQQRAEAFDESYHRSFQLSVTYSFSYGKKLRQSDEVKAINQVNSSILR